MASYLRLIFLFINLVTGGVSMELAKAGIVSEQAKSIEGIYKQVVLLKVACLNLQHLFFSI